MNCNSLENIHSCKVVLRGQTLLQRGIITNLLEKFHCYQSIRENRETFPPQTICNVW